MSESGIRSRSWRISRTSRVVREGNNASLLGPMGPEAVPNLSLPPRLGLASTKVPQQPKPGVLMTTCRPKATVQSSDKSRAWWMRWQEAARMEHTTDRGQQPSVRGGTLSPSQAWVTAQSNPGLTRGRRAVRCGQLELGLSLSRPSTGLRHAVCAWSFFCAIPVATFYKHRSYTHQASRNHAFDAVFA